MYHRIAILTLVFMFGAIAPGFGQVLGEGVENGDDGPSNKGLRYVNPLVMEEAGRLADPSVVKFEGKYYLYLTGGHAWASEDLVNWTYHDVRSVDGRNMSDAPGAFAYKGHMYLSGNSIGLFRSRDPLGPFEYMGDFSEPQPGEEGGFFDPAFFVDDDERVYLYYAGGGTGGVFGVELDGENLTRIVGEKKHFFEFEQEHHWERYGNRNEYSDQSWIEGPWMTKRNGVYYLQYSAPGTDWKTYGIGYYRGTSPLGPFTYHEGNPILLHRNGMLNGVGHHSLVEGPNGTAWVIYTILYRNRNREVERRIGLDPVGFDVTGNMVINGPSDTPQWAPGVTSRPWEGNDSGAIALSEDKNYTVSSEAPGLDAPFAFDNNIRTLWAPSDEDDEPWLQLDLGAESNQQYVVDSARILFRLPRGRSRGDSRVRHYKIEVSSDGESFEIVVDKTKNEVDNAVEFDEIGPVTCRYVRLTITGWPNDLPMGVVEFTVFGQPDSPTPTLGSASWSPEGVAKTLDALHDAASRADEEDYFALFAPNAVYVGTDSWEVWPLAEFRAYTHERFATGTGWTYHPDLEERRITIAQDGKTAWFYEPLANAMYGVARGSGTLVFQNGAWRISQYVMSFPIPNEDIEDILEITLK